MSFWKIFYFLGALYKSKNISQLSAYGSTYGLQELRI